MNGTMFYVKDKNFDLKFEKQHLAEFQSFMRLFTISEQHAEFKVTVIYWICKLLRNTSQNVPYLYKIHSHELKDHDATWTPEISREKFHSRVEGFLSMSNPWNGGQVHPWLCGKKLIIRVQKTLPCCSQLWVLDSSRLQDRERWHITNSHTPVKCR